MGLYVLPGNPPVEVTLKKSSRARRISLRVSALDGRVTLTMPRGVRETEALAFARDKAEWLRRHVSAQPAAVAVGHGAVVPVEGVSLRVEAASGRMVRIKDGSLLVPGPEAQAGARVLGYLKARARDRLIVASDRYAGILGQGFSRITLRDTRSRWGSCSSTGALNYSWRLIMAPPEVLEYVAAHEVAHLAEMNHSDAFWAVVRRIHGPYEVQRSWLRSHGGALHGYRFGD